MGTVALAVEQLRLRDAAVVPRAPAAQADPARGDREGGRRRGGRRADRAQ